MRFAVAVLIALPLTVGAQTRPANLSASDRSAIQRAQRSAQAVPGGYRAHNDTQQWSADFDRRGFEVRPDRGGWRWGLELESYGRAGKEHSVAGTAQTATDHERVTYEWNGGLREWWINNDLGLEHGYTVTQSLEGSTPLLLELRVRGSLHASAQPDCLGLTFADDAGYMVVNYAGLTVRDADGRTLKARMTAAAERVRIEIDEQGAHYPLTIDPLVQQTKFMASDAAPNNYFSDALAVNQDTAIVGAYWKTIGANPQAGTAYIFVRNGNSWVQQQELQPLDVSSYSYFGSAVAISGNTAVVGAFQKGPNFVGAAYVFVRNGTVWTLQQKLTPPDGAFFDHFGSSLSVNETEDTIVAGASWKNSKTGAAYVFQRFGATWSVTQKIQGSDSVAGDLFGYVVRINAGTLFISAPFKPTALTGAVYVFTQNDTAVWSQTQKLIAADGAGFNFGDAIAPSGDVLAIGSDGSGGGLAYVFERSASGWTQTHRLGASDGAYGDFFGWSVAVNGDMIVVGAPVHQGKRGSAYVFLRKGNTWEQDQILTAPAADFLPLNFFGWNVAITGKTVLVSSFGTDSNAGAVYVFGK